MPRRSGCAKSSALLAQRQHLAHGEIGFDGELLEHDGAPRAPGPIVTEHGHRTGVPRAGALRDLNRRRLGGTVHPEQREDLAMVDLKLTCRTA